jgi:hypothetical protein
LKKRPAGSGGISTPFWAMTLENLANVRNTTGGFDGKPYSTGSKTKGRLLWLIQALVQKGKVLSM